MAHDCFWPGCPQRISERFLMCRPHWRMVPKHLQDPIWSTANGRGTMADRIVALAAVRNFAEGRNGGVVKERLL